MKILFLSNLYPPNAIGGYEQLCFDVAAAFVARGHEVSVLTSDYGGAVAQYPGQTVFRELTLFASRRNIYAPAEMGTEERAVVEAKNAAGLKRVCADCRPDVIFVWNLYFLSAHLLHELRAANIPVAYFLTDNWLAAFLKPAYVADYFSSQVFDRPSLLHRWRARFAAWRSAQTIPGLAIFSSQFMASFYRNAGLWFDNPTIVYNGVSFQSEKVEQPDRRQFVQPGRLSLLFAGRFVEIKGVLTAIRALPLIVRSCAGLDVRLTLLGDQRDAPFVAKAKMLGQQLGVTDRIEYCLPVAEREMPALFRQHDIYLFPSLYEPFSLTLLHAMHAGIPIVASRAGGNPEAIKDLHSGLLHDVDDEDGLAEAVLRFARDPQLRMQISANAVSESARFTFDAMIDRLVECLGGVG